MCTPRKHAELIKAWADGAIIQYNDTMNGWLDVISNHPSWNVHIEYRIKPPPKKKKKGWYRIAIFKDGSTATTNHNEYD